MAANTFRLPLAFDGHTAHLEVTHLQNGAWLVYTRSRRPRARMGAVHAARASGSLSCPHAAMARPGRGERASPAGRRVTAPVGRMAPTASARALILATISFALSFAAWGLIGGLASTFTGLYELTASQTALLVAVPVLLGSLARLPMGMLTDRFGGRLVFTALLAFSSLAAFIVPLTGSYGSLLVAAFLIGMAGIVLRGRSRVRVALDTGDPAGHGPRRLRAGDDGAIAGGLCRAGRRGSAWAGRRCFAAPARFSWVGRSPISSSRVIPHRPGVPPRSPR